jgi:hypothetical protein
MAAHPPSLAGIVVSIQCSTIPRSFVPLNDLFS